VSRSYGCFVRGNVTEGWNRNEFFGKSAKFVSLERKRGMWMESFLSSLVHRTIRVFSTYTCSHVSTPVKSKLPVDTRIDI